MKIEDINNYEDAHKYLNENFEGEFDYLSVLVDKIFFWAMAVRYMKQYVDKGRME
jgi:hypothetical protein